MANTVGYKLMFPGSIRTLQFFIGKYFLQWKNSSQIYALAVASTDNAIMQGRTKLMEEERADRYKLITRDGNELDSVFVDKRKK